MRKKVWPAADSSAPWQPIIKVGRRSLLRTARTYLAIVAIALIASLGVGELYLRLAYSEGMSFSGRGPLTARFERDFQFNRYDGPSRGPELTRPSGDDGVRILIQGDSITWGKGVKEESSLYSSIVRERLRSIDSGVEVAVLAYPGREIDGHFEQLGKWGEEIDPDIIIYQWFLNDLELDKSHRPAIDRGWRRFVFPWVIRQHSYLWYLLDYRIGVWLQPGPQSDHMYTYYSKGTEEWRAFAALFHGWAVEAKRLTPNVLVALYPYLLPSPEVPFREFNAWVEELCAEEGLAVIDLLEPLEVFRGDFTQAYASPFDSHPNAAAHAAIADALFDRILALWPNVFHPRPDQPTDDQGHV
jgi:hypothetical protein